MSEPTRPVKALLHAMQVLDSLAREGRPLGVSELARQTGLSKAATYSILTTLKSRDVVAQDPATSRYRLGWHLYELSEGLIAGQDVVRVGRPYLEQLAASIGETVLIGIQVRSEVLFVASAESPHAVRMVAAPGRRVPMHSTATGRVLLSEEPPEVVESLISKGLPAMTGRTITTREELLRGLVFVRRNGYATAWMENEPEMASISVPVRGRWNTIEAALTASGPIGRFTDDSVSEWIQLLKEGALGISKELGARALDDAPST
jgi:DNA-binding IclR family transcriptional regulator